MIDLAQIESFYPEHLRPFKRNILREYLQHKILEVVFSSKYGAKMCFMGGTACHIIYKNDRFSEDLDFDNRGLTKKQFAEMAEFLKNRMALEGYKTEIDVTTNENDIFHCYIKFEKLLFILGISKNNEEKLLIQIDTEPQKYNYKPEQPIINNFDVFMRFNVVPIDLLLSQKICAIFTRKRPMGRDFYDVIFLLGRTKPDYKYLSDKLGIQDVNELKERLIEKCRNLDFSKLAKDVEPFLFIPENSKKLLLFSDFVKEI